MNLIIRCLSVNNVGINSKLLSLKSIFVENFLNNQRRNSSSLYIPGNKANKELSFLRPDLSFDNDFKDLEKLKRRLDLRDYTFDIEKLKVNWDLYQSLKQQKHSLELNQKVYSGQINSLKNNVNSSTDETQKINDLTNKSKLLKAELRKIKEHIWVIEETIMPELLKLPNEIDERTPQQIPITLKKVGQKPDIHNHEILDNLTVGRNLGLLDYKNPIQYFLCDEAALYECAILDLCSNILKANGMARVAGPDFCRSIVVEGAGLDHESGTSTFILQGYDRSEINRLHLVGSASLPALLAIYTKKVSNATSFPIKVFSTGRQYVPVQNDLEACGLFSVCQSSVVQTTIFVDAVKSEMHETELQNLIEAASKIYDEIGSHYQVTIKPAKELDPAESMRISFEMWSAYLKHYIEVGYISVCGDYFSKRLLIGSRTPGKVDYTAAITGSLLSVPKVLGCLLEENPKEFILPEKIKGFLS